MKRTRTRRIAALLLAGALVAGACSDDEATDAADTSEDADAAADEPTEEATEESEEPAEDEPAEDEPAEDEPAEEEPPAEPTGDPIQVMATGTIESAVFSLPSIPVGAQIAVDEINAAGGIGGRPLELVVCNDEFDPNKATACVQQATQDGVVALVGGLSVFEPALMPLLEAQNTPWIGLSSGVLFSSPVLFPIAADGTTAFAGIGAASAAQGCTNSAVVISAQGSPENTAAISAGLEANGVGIAAELQANGPDLAPLVESALGAGADCISTGVSPAEIGPLLAAVAGRVPVATVDGSLPAGLLQGLGPAADGVAAISGFLLPGFGNAKVDALAEASLAVAPDVSLDQFWFSGYVGVYVVAEALRDAAEISPAAVLEGIPGVQGYDTGLGPVLDFSVASDVPGYESLYNPNLYLLEAAGGAWTLLDPEPVDMSPAIELLGS